MITYQGQALERQLRETFRQRRLRDALDLTAALIIIAIILSTAPTAPHGAEAGVFSLAPASIIQE